MCGERYKNDIVGKISSKAFQLVFIHICYGFFEVI